MSVMGSLEEEHRCAERLLDALPRVTETFLARTESGQRANV